MLARVRVRVREVCFVFLFPSEILRHFVFQGLCLLFVYALRESSEFFCYLSPFFLFLLFINIIIIVTKVHYRVFASKTISVVFFFTQPLILFLALKNTFLFLSTFFVSMSQKSSRVKFSSFLAENIFSNSISTFKGRRRVFRENAEDAENLRSFRTEINVVKIFCCCCSSLIGPKESKQNGQTTFKVSLKQFCLFFSSLKRNEGG